VLRLRRTGLGAERGEGGRLRIPRAARSSPEPSGPHGVSSVAHSEVRASGVSGGKLEG